MGRKLSLILAFVGLLGMIGFTPAANANHDGGPGQKNDEPHENSPRPPEPGNPIGICTVLGTVDIDDPENEGGVAAPQDAKNHNHYQFRDTEIECRANPDKPDQGQAFHGAFTVHAAGGTDGQGECDGAPGKDPKCHTDHGEDASVGWSHSDCYAAAAGCVATPKGVSDLYAGTSENDETSGQPYNFNEIAVSSVVAGGPESCLPSGPGADKDDVDDTCANWLKFCRGAYDDDDDTGESMEEALVPDATCSNQDQTDDPDKLRVSTGGGNVLAWGQLFDTATSGPPLCFMADLEFVPDSVAVKAGTAKIESAVLVGTATIWHPPAGAACDAGKKNKTT